MNKFLLFFFIVFFAKADANAQIGHKIKSYGNKILGGGKSKSKTNNTDSLADINSGKNYCSSKEFEESNSAVYTEDKYLREFLFDFSLSENNIQRENYQAAMKEQLRQDLAKKINTKVSSVERMERTEKSSNNALDTKENYSSSTKSESNVDLSGTEFHFCADRRQHDVYHAMIYIDKRQFISSQMSLIKVKLRDLVSQVNNLFTNMDSYAARDLSNEYAECVRKRNKVNSMIEIYLAISSRDELSSDTTIQTSKDNVSSKLSQIGMKINSKDLYTKIDSAQALIISKKYKEAMNVIDFVLRVNPTLPQAKEAQKLCLDKQTEEINYKIQDLIRNKEFEEAIKVINQALDDRIAFDEMEKKLASVEADYFNECASKIENYVQRNDYIDARKYLNKMKPYSKIDQRRFDAMSDKIWGIEKEKNLDELKVMIYHKEYDKADIKIIRLSEEFQKDNDDLINYQKKIYDLRFRSAKKDTLTHRPRNYCVSLGLGLLGSDLNSQSSNVGNYADLNYSIGFYRRWHIKRTNKSIRERKYRFGSNLVGIRYSYTDFSQRVKLSGSSTTAKGKLTDIQVSNLIGRAFNVNFGIATSSADNFSKTYFTGTIGLRFHFILTDLNLDCRYIGDFSSVNTLLPQIGLTRRINFHKKLSDIDETAIRTGIINHRDELFRDNIK